ncbi:TPA: hypothetical protein ACKRLH_000195 [Pseudomonas aeruginosa]
MGYLMICPAILGIILTIIPTVTLGQGEGRVFVRTKGGEISAEIPNTPNWFQPELTFTVRAQEDVYFNGREISKDGKQGRITLQKVIGGIRAGLQSVVVY